jgi:hypothetical protein
MRWVAANYEGDPNDKSPIVYRHDALQIFRRKVSPTVPARAK